MTTLADFILARVAEIEAVARAVVDEHEMHGWESYVEGAGMYAYPAGEFAKQMTPARVLAQCEAVRRIVELLRHPADSGEPVPREYARLTLELMARTYADHEDYREEWWS